MSTTAIEPAGVVSPTAMASGSQSAAHQLGQVLLDLVHKTGVYATEEALRLADAAVQSWVNSVVPAPAMRALATGVQRAPMEDVSQRTPPGGMVSVYAPQQAQPIDYDKLAAALVRAQQAQRQAPPPPQQVPYQ